MSTETFLASANDSVLILIDLQDHFVKKISTSLGESITSRAIWLIKVARYLNIPIVATAEDIASTGNLSDPILNALSEEVLVHDKNRFGLGDHPEIMDDIENKHRNTMILIGMETDVCVAQSALLLIKKGYRVVVIKDAVATTSEFDNDIGLIRMSKAGVVISSTKAIYYEWLASVDNLKLLLAKFPDVENLAPVKL